MLSNITVVGATMCHAEPPSGFRHSFPLAASIVLLMTHHWLLSTGRELPHSRGNLHPIIAGWRTEKAQFLSSVETTLEIFVELTKASLATITAQYLFPSNLPSLTPLQMLFPRVLPGAISIQSPFPGVLAYNS